MHTSATPLDHIRQVDRHAGRPRHRPGAVEDDGEEQRGGDGAERVQLRQRGDDDAGIAVAGREVGGHLEAHAADLAGAGEPGERAGDQRCDQDDAADLHAGIVRRGRIVADRADLEAERRARQHPPDDDRGNQRQQHAEMHVDRTAGIGNSASGRIDGEFG